MVQIIRCPNCGADLPLTSRVIRFVVCEYCNQGILIKDKRIDPTGRVATQIEINSPLKLHTRGWLRGKFFEVIGIMRCSFGRGYWDEWLLHFDEDNSDIWLQFDDGSWVLFYREDITRKLPPLTQLKVGTIIPFRGERLYLREKGEAKVLYAKGGFAFEIMPGDNFYYIDGTLGDKEVSIEYYSNGEISMSWGEEITKFEIKIEQ